MSLHNDCRLGRRTFTYKGPTFAFWGQGRRCIFIRFPSKRNPALKYFIFEMLKKTRINVKATARKEKVGRSFV
jgi:hypothetical protein